MYMCLHVRVYYTPFWGNNARWVTEESMVPAVAS